VEVSADILTISRPILSELALESVVPSPRPPPRLSANTTTSGTLNQRVCIASVRARNR
jgi:hypothetical protein